MNKVKILPAMTK